VRCADSILNLGINRVISKLKDKYPGKKIIKNPPDNPTEIICEIEPTSDHPEKSLAVAVVGRSPLHYHKHTTEIYEAIRGKLTLYKNGKKHKLNKGDKITIKPGEVHYVEGKETWFKTYSSPGWTFKDHILKIEKK